MFRYLQKASELTGKSLVNQSRMAVGNETTPNIPDPGIISHMTKFMTARELTHDIKRPLKRTKIVATIG